jgi:hypothetical protein
MGVGLDVKPGDLLRIARRTVLPLSHPVNDRQGHIACAAMKQICGDRAAAELKRGLRQLQKPSACLRSMRQQVRFLPGAFPIQAKPGWRSQEATLDPFRPQFVEHTVGRAHACAIGTLLPNFRAPCSPEATAWLLAPTSPRSWGKVSGAAPGARFCLLRTLGLTGCSSSGC